MKNIHQTFSWRTTVALLILICAFCAPSGLEKRTGSTSVRAIMERKMREKAEAQDPELERKTADLLKWQMENKQQNNKPGNKPIQKPELQQSGPRGVEHNMRGLDKLTPEELEDLGFDPLA